jgi:hypothetical protein
VALVGDAAQVIIHRIRVTPQQLGRRRDPQPAKISGDGRTDVRNAYRARDLCQDLNATRERDRDARRPILKQLFGRGGESVWMQPP